MILEIKKYPHPILRKKCQNIKEITQEIKMLGQDMAETMAKNNGAGLAASQVGKLLKIITIHTGKEPVILINPKIIKKSKKQEIMEEGCLSIPGIWLKIKRAEEIEVEALDKDGEKIKTKAEGLSARVLQHEIDHLQGILLIDRLGLFQRLKVRTRLRRNLDSLR